MNKKPIAQGAEASIFLKTVEPAEDSLDPQCEALPNRAGGNESDASDSGTLKNQKIILKERIPKSYRHAELDGQIRKRRTRREAKLLAKAREAGALVPAILNQTDYTLEIEFIDGDRLSETLSTYSKAAQAAIMKELAIQVAKLHEKDIIHGDLTTSNTILKGSKVFIIDFGLGFISKRIEDKAVDIHLIKQALNAKHFQHYEDLLQTFLEHYNPSEKKKILERLAAVEKRGRYRH